MAGTILSVLLGSVAQAATGYHPGQGKPIPVAVTAASPHLSRLLATDPGAPPPFNILCGTSKGLAGVVHAAVLPLSVPDSGSARHDAVERAAGLTPAALGIAARMSCRPGHWLPAQEGNEVLVAPCFLNEGG